MKPRKKKKSVRWAEFCSPNSYVEAPIPSTSECECIILHSQRDFADVIELRILRWANYPDSSR